MPQKVGKTEVKVGMNILYIAYEVKPTSCKSRSFLQSGFFGTSFFYSNVC